MRRFGKWLGRILLMLILAVATVGFWNRDDISRLLTVNALFDQGKIVQNFSHMNQVFPTVPLDRGHGATSELFYGPETNLPDGAQNWIAQRSVTSLLVLKDGEIRYEEYFLGTGPDDLRISWSLAKSYLSALFGVMLDEGAIDSIDDPVTKYAPELAGSAYDGVSIRNVLNMSSGVRFDEDYLKFGSDINRMGRIVALGGTLDDFTASFVDRSAEPGEEWAYVSIDTHVIGMVIRGATGRSIAALLSEKIIAPLGQEQDGYYITDGSGAAFVLGGLNLTTRDHARFGLMIEQNGHFNGQQIVPADWIAAATASSAPTPPGEMQYGYQWWVPVRAEKGEFFARGIYGQYLYIDQERDVVIVVTGSDRQFQSPGTHEENIAMLRKIAASL
ncbi:serine hydrolase domain-containing protein [Pontibaca salina]|uniref:Serine hydrolase n=1 Tax=Pontibaca salina TaxID=2795731 RepID=A0A934HSA5_9RHOB|nr:serine hydrolase [Pontibaca salina]MBI6630502.1 serine hydrolase [Pontibaca salina]